mmetsp:Transcript_19611/g.45613  ORF Transcript_19611/g.45613 Transcript_19611/m.45613 type:complete len:257 (-) Transcript_19611:79-849(-)
MALELDCCNTFINATVKGSEESVEACSRRAQSLPRERVRRVSLCREEQTMADMRNYVRSLSTNVADLPKHLHSEEMAYREVPPLEMSEFLPFLPSQGSLGHPEACRRPCIYFAAGHCTNSKDCAYCHMGHLEKTPKLDKRQRTIIQSLSRPQLVVLVMQFCRDRAEQAGFLQEASGILQLLSTEALGAPPLSQLVSDRDVRNLRKTLARMNFSNLIGLVTQHEAANCAGNTSQDANSLAKALDVLRLQFPREHGSC